MSKIAIMLSGQGTQYSGMGKDIYNNIDIAREILDSLEEKHFGLKKMMFEGSKEELKQTLNAQPAMFAVDMMAALSLIKYGIKPYCVAGFSVGEIPALAVCNIMSMESAFELVNVRAKIMNKCTEDHQGLMYAIIGLDQIELKQIIEKIDNVYCVNMNSELQTVISGDIEAVNIAVNKIKELGIRAIKLEVSGAFHTPYMKEASLAIDKFLDNKIVLEPSIPLYSNYTGKLYQNDIKENIIEQVSNPVQWLNIIKDMIDDGVDVFIEAGCGKVLANLVLKIKPDAIVHNVDNSESMKSVLRIYGGNNV